MKKKALVLALTSALVAPQAFAAQDTSGMRYTSASEGFYASIRTRYNSNGGETDGNSKIENSGSRIGIRGTNDLGGGLEGFYRWEMAVDTDQGSKGNNSTRLGYVGLRGNFGSMSAGSDWNHMYNRVMGSTDIGNVHSGHFAFVGRHKNAIQYNTPNLNGFSAGVHVGMEGTSAADNDVDNWGLSADYAVSGFSVAAAYYNVADGHDPDETAGSGDEDDQTYLAVKAGYAQDNWYVNSWYGEENTSDDGNDATDDTETLSFAAGIAVDKTNLYLIHDSQDNGAADVSQTTVGVQYNLGSFTRVWVEYGAQDTDDAADDDLITIGLQHDF